VINLIVAVVLSPLFDLLARRGATSAAR
jgi:hypothetical protein